MGIKVSVEKKGNVFLVHDNGQIAKYLGAEAAHFDNSLGFVVEHPNHIGSAVEQMEKLLREWSVVRANNNRVRNTKPVTPPVVDIPPAPRISAKEHLERTGGPIPAKRNGSGRVKTEQLTLDDLGLKNQQIWRLKAAKITTLKKLGALTEKQLLAKKGIGSVIVKAVKKGLKKHGLRLTSPVG